MIKHSFCLLLLSIAIIAAAASLQDDPGYVLIVFQNWQLQSSFVVFILSLCLVLGLIMTLLHLLGSGLQFPTKLAQMFKHWKIKRCDNEVQQGIEAYIQENWNLAYAQLEKHTNHAWYLHLLAADCAQKQGLYQKRNQALIRAAQSTTTSNPSIFIAQAKFQINARQYEQAQATLAHIPDDLCLKLPIWHKLQSILDFKVQAYSRVLKRLETHTSILKHENWYLPFYQTAVLESLAQELEKKDALLYFKALPKALQTSPKILRKFSPWLEDASFFQKIIQTLLEKQPLSHDICELIVSLTPKPSFISILEQKLEAEINQPKLHYCLGTIYAKQQLWGQALRHLKASQTQAALLQMAKIYLELQQVANAMQAMQDALRL